MNNERKAICPTCKEIFFVYEFDQYLGVCYNCSKSYYDKQLKENSDLQNSWRDYQLNKK